MSEVLSQADGVVVGKPTQEFIYGRVHRELLSRISAFDPEREQYPILQWTYGAFAIDRVITGTGFVFGQSYEVSEPVGLRSYGSRGVVKNVIENCYEIKQNATYLLFLKRKRDGKYQTFNGNLGRFNLDGTDPEDEIGGGFRPDGTKTEKQKLREELMAPPYNVVFKRAPQINIKSHVLRVPQAVTPKLPAGSRLADLRVVIYTPQIPSAKLITERQRADGTWEVCGRKRVPTISTTGTETVNYSMNAGVQTVPTTYRLLIEGGNYSVPYTVPMQ
ncbi:MAG: hypothetical protein H7Y38_06910 [Armatimonadetes bacterium]|nr:hypothetical protein [Armatimonadota bacterium]